MGAPHKWNPTNAAAIIRMAGKTIPKEIICRTVGISMETLRQWRREGEREDAPEDKRKFAKDYVEAELFAVERLVDVVIRAAEEDGDWKAAMTLLERRLPQYFARRDPGVEEMREQVLDLQKQLLAALTGNQPIPGPIRDAIAAKNGAGDDGDGVGDDGGVEG